MDASDEIIAKGATLHEEEEPLQNQYLKHRGRSNSPPWRKLLVYDCEQQAIEIRSEKNIGQLCASFIHAPWLIRSPLSDKDQCQIVDLPPNRKQVTIFVDPETESKPTIDSRAADGQSNVVLATLYLNRLGAFHQVLRFLGLMSTLYVINASATK